MVHPASTLPVPPPPGVAWAGLQGAEPALPAAELASSTDWTAVGLMLAMAGCFLLANSILFRPPRELVDEYARGRARSLQSIRGYLFHRVQVTIGFLLLIAGFGVQLATRVGGAPAPAAAGFPVGWFGGILALVAVLEGIGWWLSRFLFQRAIRRAILAGDLRLENDSRVVREVGELFGVPLRPEDTVHSYAARVRERVDLPERWPAREGASPAPFQPAEEA